MIALVTGGAASGKSAFAERLATALPGPHTYIATMRHGDAETEARIDRHRSMREGKGFTTVELAETDEPEHTPRKAQANRSSLSARQLRNSPASQAQTVLATASPSLVTACEELVVRSGSSALTGTALLEDLGNLVANGLEDKLEYVLGYDNVVIVANEVGCDGISYDDFTMEYINSLGALACRLAAQSDVVVEVVSGIPYVVKGELPCEC